MLWLKKFMIYLAMLALGIAVGGFVGFALGYIIAGDGRSNIHGGAILVYLLTIGGAVAGLIVGSAAASRLASLVT